MGSYSSSAGALAGWSVLTRQREPDRARCYHRGAVRVGAVDRRLGRQFADPPRVTRIFDVEGQLIGFHSDARAQIDHGIARKNLSRRADHELRKPISCVMPINSAETDNRRTQRVLVRSAEAARQKR